MGRPSQVLCIFFFNDTATTEIYTLSLHDALPIYLFQDSVVSRAWQSPEHLILWPVLSACRPSLMDHCEGRDRKSTRLNSSHANISYAVFCLKKKKVDRLTTVWLFPLGRTRSCYRP